MGHNNDIIKNRKSLQIWQKETDKILSENKTYSSITSTSKIAGIYCTLKFQFKF